MPQKDATMQPKQTNNVNMTYSIIEKKNQPNYKNKFQVHRINNWDI